MFQLKYLGVTMVEQPKGEELSAAAVKRIVATVRKRLRAQTLLCQRTQSSAYFLVEKASAWLPTVSLLVSGASSHSEDAISLDTGAEFLARPALSSLRSLNVIALGSTALE